MSSVVSESLALPAIPALLMRIRGWPKSFFIRATMSSTWLRWVTSQTMAVARGPTARMALTASSRTSAERPLTATSAPAWAKESAMARPIPRPPPVTSPTRPARSPTLMAVQDLGQFGKVDVAAGNDAGDAARARFPRQRDGQGDGTGALGDHAVSFRHQPQRRRDLLEAGRKRAVEQLLRHHQHVGEDRLAPDAIDKRGLVIDNLRRAGFHRGGQRRAGLRFHRVDAHPRLERAKRGGDAARQPTASPGNQDGVDLRQVLEQLETDGAVARHHAIVIEGMYEHGVDAGIASIAEGLPPAVERHLDHAAAEALDRLDLRVRGIVGRDHGARNAEPPRVPGGALRHVSGTGDHDAFGQLGLRHRVHRVGRPADFEGPDRLKVLKLEINVGRCVQDVEAHDRRTDGGLCDHRLRTADRLDAEPGRLHIFTLWPVPVSRARRTI